MTDLKRDMGIAAEVYDTVGIYISWSLGPDFYARR